MLYRQNFDPDPFSGKYLILISPPQFQVMEALLGRYKMKILPYVHTLHQNVEGFSGQLLKCMIEYLRFKK